MAAAVFFGLCSLKEARLLWPQLLLCTLQRLQWQLGPVALIDFPDQSPTSLGPIAPTHCIQLQHLYPQPGVNLLTSLPAASFQPSNQKRNLKNKAWTPRDLHLPPDLDVLSEVGPSLDCHRPSQPACTCPVGTTKSVGLHSALRSIESHSSPL